jgi:excisionase family DNA binding protein
MSTTDRPQPTTHLAFTSSEAARYLGVSLATVRRWSNAGHLPGYRTPGGQRRFSRIQLDQFLASLDGGEQRRSTDAGSEHRTATAEHRGSGRPSGHGRTAA